MSLVLWLVLGLVLAGLVLWFVLHNRGNWNRVWMIEVGDTYLRFWPNFGFQVGNLRWSRHWKRLPVYKPKKWGLEPKKLAEEGSDLYNLRMEYYHDSRAYLKERGFVK